jgi:hypothetical protein
LCCRLARPEHGDSGGADIIGQSGDQRRFGADDHQRDVFRSAERHHRSVVGRVERDAVRMARYSRIAGRGIEPREDRRLRQLPRQRMFAPARADQQDIHGRDFPHR